MTLRKFVAVIAVALAVPFVGPASAGAQSADASTQHAFGLKAALFGKTDLDDGHFAYALARGTSVHDAAEVINFTDAPLSLSLYAADVKTAAGGGALAPAQRGAEMFTVGRWLVLDDPTQAAISLPPKGRVTVPFTLTVPADAAFGDFTGAFVAARPSTTANGVGVEARVALLMRVTVPGTTHLNGRASKPHVSRAGGGYDIETDVSNTGNVLFTTRAEIEIRNGDDVIARLPVDRKEIYVIPGGKTRLRARWTDPPAFGTRSAVARVKVFVNGEYQRTLSSPAAHIRLVPWRVVAGGGIVIVGSGSFLLLFRRRIGAWRARRRDEKAMLRRYRESGGQGSADA